MRALAIWLAIAAAGHGALAAGYHLYLTSSPRRLAVVLDSSFPMRPVWSQVEGALDRLGERRYTVFSLFTEKSRVHGWSPRFRPGRVTPYAPRDFAGLAALAATGELAEADEVVMITNATDAETGAPSGWRVERLRP